MKYLLFCFVLVVMPFAASAQEIYRGIEFHHGDWQSAVEKAKAGDKLIFIDFMTEWCGPCLNMAEEVFPRSFIGDFYNRHFVCMKVDAEKGEGVGLAKKYEVQVFPTFVFVNPVDGHAVHRSTSRQSADTFLFTGESAIDPNRRSYYLEASYREGRRDGEFLIDYINYCASVYKRDEVRRAFDLLMEGGAELSDPAVWKIFDQYITGTDNPWFRTLVENYDDYVSSVGREAADRKLYRETRNLPADKFEGLPDFEGKELNRQMAEVNSALRQKNYRDADEIITRLIHDPGIDRQELMGQLKFALRGSYWAGDTPAEWLKRCAEYLQYIAYNYADREDASIHLEYALMLERLIRLDPGASDIFPAPILGEPEVGEKSYSLRSPKLAVKPRRK